MTFFARSETIWYSKFANILPPIAFIKSTRRRNDNKLRNKVCSPFIGSTNMWFYHSQSLEKMFFGYARLVRLLCVLALASLLRDTLATFMPENFCPTSQVIKSKEKQKMTPSFPHPTTTCGICPVCTTMSRKKVTSSKLIDFASFSHCPTWRSDNQAPQCCNTLFGRAVYTCRLFLLIVTRSCITFSSSRCGSDLYQCWQKQVRNFEKKRHRMTASRTSCKCFEQKVTSHVFQDIVYEVYLWCECE